MTKFQINKPHPAGTLLQVTVFGLIKHVGIATGYGTVIHTSRRFGRVYETDMGSFTSNGRVMIIPYSHATLNGSEIVARARSKKGQRYNALFNNCEHFVSWVLTGKKRSRQLGPVDPRKIMPD
ncbi:MAG: lecithin retinol acyltransferase family protein [Maricaulaceae bacterium]